MFQKIIAIGSPGAGTDICLSGVESRIGKEREDLPWVEQEFDAEFRQFITNFRTDSLPRIYELLEKYRNEKRIIIFKSREESEKFLL